ncbi:hypothetical protein IU450_09935 [Nocardia abscessus]|uniref:hypothetical protein n=1 Tax=Nocardia abscessus TaxID=120957 RepID=UPI001895C8EE|nr:hypothetical protein [Nocardia abscessus]MBF6336203.1 hypothetical protein [Nocardia abscessus]
MTSAIRAQRRMQRRPRAGAFGHRVELVEGEVRPVVIGSWHGRARSPGQRV